MSPHPLDGMHYDVETHQYMPDVVSETINPFTLLSGPTRIDGLTLPQSPKATFKRAVAAGWEASAWRSTGTQDPTLFLSDFEEGAKEPHNAGDVRWDGYDATLFVVEARVPHLPIAFQAFFRGKTYAPELAKKAVGGSFEYAQVLDPVGVPVALVYDYPPIGQTRGDYETEASFQRRIDDSVEMAARVAEEHNDGEVAFMTRHVFEAAKQFDAWLAEWLPFTTQRESNA